MFRQINKITQNIEYYVHFEECALCFITIMIHFLLFLSPPAPCCSPSRLLPSLCPSVRFHSHSRLAAGDRLRSPHCWRRQQAS
jgi:hypothetical protein|eukprot:COSAG06_NODE_3839_length_4850_cov_1.534203_7_plen_83_part_00